MSTDPRAAFELLRPGRANTISELGPGFFTKYLYFAGGGNPDHPCAIVDSVVRATLHEHTGSFAPWSQYPADEYARALEVLRAWARHASDELERPVALDEVEKWAFSPA